MLPHPPGDIIWVVVPSALHVVWLHIPGYFSCATENIIYIINYHVYNNKILYYHPEEVNLSLAVIPIHRKSRHPSKMLYIYVDEFCNTFTQSIYGIHIPTIIISSIHRIHVMFMPSDITGNDIIKKTIPQKTLHKRDGYYPTQN